MNNYIKKVSHTLLLGLGILVIALLIYLIYPKYQIQTVRVDDNYVVITKVNTITGETIVSSEKVFRSVFDDFEFND